MRYKTCVAKAILSQCRGHNVLHMYCVAASVLALSRVTYVVDNTGGLS